MLWDELFPPMAVIDARLVMIFSFTPCFITKGHTGLQCLLELLTQFVALNKRYFPIKRYPHSHFSLLSSIITNWLHQTLFWVWINFCSITMQFYIPLKTIPYCSHENCCKKTLEGELSLKGPSNKKLMHWKRYSCEFVSNAMKANNHEQVKA